jgi:hypothetical protein
MKKVCEYGPWAIVTISDRVKVSSANLKRFFKNNKQLEKVSNTCVWNMFPKISNFELIVLETIEKKQKV